MIVLPSGWTQRGQLPFVDFVAAGDRERDLFDEDILQIKDRTGEYVLDVGWYPAESEQGHFRCRLIVSNEWEFPEEEFETTSVAKVSEWLASTVEAVHDSLGQSAEFSEDVFLTLPVVAVRVRGAAIGVPNAVETKIPPPMLQVEDVIRAAEQITGRERTPKTVPPEMFESRAHAA
jgi:hypothetical protein